MTGCVLFALIAVPGYLGRSSFFLFLLSSDELEDSRLSQVIQSFLEFAVSTRSYSSFFAKFAVFDMDFLVVRS